MTDHSVKVEEVLNEALHPDEVEWHTFLRVLSKDKNGTELRDIAARLKAGGLTEITLRPMTNKWDRAFRKHAMPILGAQIQPLEMLLGAIVRDEIMVATEMGIGKALISSELEADEQLAPAVGAICAAQDPIAQNGKTCDRPALVKKWAEVVDEHLMRSELVILVEAQGRIQKEIAGLGESFAARFRIVQSLVGDRLDLTGLLLDSLKPAGKLSGLTGMTNTTLPNSATDSSEKPPIVGSTPSPEVASA